MLQHNVMLALVEGATDEQRAAIIAALRALPGQIPGLESIVVRSDAGLVPGNAHVMFTMSFTDESSWRAYTSHPAHEVLANDHILPILSVKTALQYVD